MHKRITLRMTEELEKKVKEEAEKKGLSINSLILSILNKEINQSKE